MTSLRRQLLPMTSLALVTAATFAVMIDAAHAQDGETVPVRYGTDPGYAIDGPQILSFRDEDAPAPAGEILHQVKKGETIYALGRLYDIPPSNIIAKNGLTAPFSLSIGQTLVIPMAPLREDPPVVIEPVGIEPAVMPRVAEQARHIPVGQFQLDGTHVVRQGDTMYSISRMHGLSVADLSAANGIYPPYTIAVGQRLVIPGASAARSLPAPREVVERSTVPNSRAMDVKVIEETFGTEPVQGGVGRGKFAWPVRGTVLVDFGDEKNGEVSQGINIAAPIGAPVRASADGEVVYRGAELNGFGNLLLVKHADGWVSAYAHTDAILVRKGDYVRRGQVIAKVGRSGTVERPQLHFQLRKDLQPQDPIIALQGDAPGLTSASLQ